MAKPNIDIRELSPDERLELIGALWDSLNSKPDGRALTDPQREEIVRRIDDMDSDETLGIPSQDVLNQIRKGK